MDDIYGWGENGDQEENNDDFLGDDEGWGNDLDDLDDLSVDTNEGGDVIVENEIEIKKDATNDASHLDSNVTATATVTSTTNEDSTTTIQERIPDMSKIHPPSAPQLETIVDTTTNNTTCIGFEPESGSSRVTPSPSPPTTTQDEGFSFPAVVDNAPNDNNEEEHQQPQHNEDEGWDMEDDDLEGLDDDDDDIITNDKQTTSSSDPSLPHPNVATPVSPSPSPFSVPVEAVRTESVGFNVEDALLHEEVSTSQAAASTSGFATTDVHQNDATTKIAAAQSNSADIDLAISQPNEQDLSPPHEDAEAAAWDFEDDLDLEGDDDLNLEDDVDVDHDQENVKHESDHQNVVTSNDNDQCCSNNTKAYDESTEQVQSIGKDGFDDKEKEADVEQMQLEQHSLPLTRPVERLRSCSVSVEDELYKEEMHDFGVAVDRSEQQYHVGPTVKDELPTPNEEEGVSEEDHWNLEEDDLIIDDVNDEINVNEVDPELGTSTGTHDMVYNESPSSAVISPSTVVPTTTSTCTDSSKVPVSLIVEPIKNGILAPPGSREVVSKERAMEIVHYWTKQLELLGAEPQSSQITHLDLSNKSYTSEGAKIICHFLMTPSSVPDKTLSNSDSSSTSLLSKVTVANLSDIIASRMEEEGLDVLQQICTTVTKYAPLLKEVDLSDNAIGFKGLTACKPLLTQCSHLHSIRFCNNGLDELSMTEIVDWLCEVNPTTQQCTASRLECIHFAKNMSGHGGCVAFARLMKHCDFSILKDIRFSGTRADHKGSLAVVKAMCHQIRQVKNKTPSIVALERLDLSDNTLKQEGGNLLAEGVVDVCPNLMEFNIRDCLLDDDGLIVICDSLTRSLTNKVQLSSSSYPTLKKLDISGNDLTHGSIKHSLVPFLRKSSVWLEELYVEDNDIDSRGVEAIAHAFRDSMKDASLNNCGVLALTKISLLSTQCGRRGAQAWLDLVRSKNENNILPRLQYFNMDGNYIPSCLVMELKEAFGTAWVDVNDNDEEDDVDDDLSSDGEQGSAEHKVSIEVPDEMGGLASLIAKETQDMRKDTTEIDEVGLVPQDTVVTMKAEDEVPPDTFDTTNNEIASVSEPASADVVVVPPIRDGILEPPGDREVVTEERAHEFVTFWKEQLKQKEQGTTTTDDDDDEAAPSSEIIVVTTLNLSNKSYTIEAARVIGNFLTMSSSFFSNVLKVDLSDIIASRMEDEALEVLRVICNAVVEATSLTLEYINLSDNAIGSKGIQICMSALGQCPRLHSIRFCNNGLDSISMNEIVTKLCDMASDSTTCIASRLTEIYFSKNMSGHGGCVAFAKLIQHCSLDKLSKIQFSGTRADRSGSMLVLQAMNDLIRSTSSRTGTTKQEEWSSWNALTYLDLGDNIFGIEGANVLGDVLCQCPSLHYLNVRDCCLEDDGCHYICKALVASNCPLEYLDLSGNDLTYKSIFGTKVTDGAGVGVARLARTKGTTLESLHLEENELGSRGIVQLIRELAAFHRDNSHTTALKELNVAHNECKSRGAKVILEYYYFLSCLHSFNLDGNQFSQSLVDELKETFGEALLSMEENDEPDEEEEEEDDDDEDWSDDDNDQKEEEQQQQQEMQALNEGGRGLDQQESLTGEANNNNEDAVEKEEHPQNHVNEDAHHVNEDAHHVNEDAENVMGQEHYVPDDQDEDPSYYDEEGEYDVDDDDDNNTVEDDNNEDDGEFESVHIQSAPVSTSSSWFGMIANMVSPSKLSSSSSPQQQQQPPQQEPYEDEASTNEHDIADDDHEDEETEEPPTDGWNDDEIEDLDLAVAGNDNEQQDLNYDEQEQQYKDDDIVRAAPQTCSEEQESPPAAAPPPAALLEEVDESDLQLMDAPNDDHRLSVDLGDGAGAIQSSQQHEVINGDIHRNDNISNESILAKGDDNNKEQIPSDSVELEDGWGDDMNFADEEEGEYTIEDLDGNGNGKNGSDNNSINNDNNRTPSEELQVPVESLTSVSSGTVPVVDQNINGAGPEHASTSTTWSNGNGGVGSVPPSTMIPTISYDDIVLPPVPKGLDLEALYKEEATKNQLLETHRRTLEDSVQQMEKLITQMETYYKNHEEETKQEMDRMVNELADATREANLNATLATEREQELIALRQCLHERDEQMKHLSLQMEQSQQTADERFDRSQEEFQQTIEGMKQDHIRELNERQHAFDTLQTNYNMGEEQYRNLQQEHQHIVQALDHAKHDVQQHQSMEISLRMELEESKDQLQTKELEWNQRLEDEVKSVEIKYENRIREMEQHLQRATDELNQSKEQQINLQQSIDTMIAEQTTNNESTGTALAQSQKRVEVLEAELSQVRTQLMDAQAETADVTNQLADNENMLRASREETTNLEGQVLELRQDVEESHQRQQTIEAEKQTLHQQVASLEATLEATKSNQSESSSQVQSLTERLQETENRNIELEQQIQTLVTEKDAVSAENEEVLIQLALDAKEIERLEKHVEELNTYIEQQGRTASMEHESLQFQLTAARNDLERVRLEQQASVASSSSQQAEESLTATTLLNDANHRIETLEREIQTLKSRQTELAREEELAKGDKARLDAENQTLLGRLSEKERDLEVQSQEHEISTSRLQAQNQVLSDEIKHLNEDVYRLQNELNEASRSSHELHEAKEFLQQEVTSKQMEVETLAKQLAEAQSQQQPQAQQADVAPMLQNIAQLEQEVARLSSILYERDAEINNLRQQKDDLDSQLTQKVERIEVLERSLSEKVGMGVKEEARLETDETNDDFGDGWDDDGLDEIAGLDDEAVETVMSTNKSVNDGAPSTANRHLEDELDAARNELAQLREEVKSKTRAIDDLQRDKDSLQGSVEDLNEQIQMLNSNFNSDLELEREKLRSLEEDVSKSRHLQRQAEQRASELSEQQTLWAAAKNDETDHGQKAIDTLERQLDETKALVEGNEAMLMEKDALLEERDALVEKLQRDVTELRAKLEEIGLSMAQKEAKLREAQSQIDENKASLEHYLVVVEELRQTKKSLLDEVASQQLELQRIKEAGVSIDIPSGQAESVDFMREKIVALATALERSEQSRAEAMERLSQERQAGAETLRRVGDNVMRLSSAI